MKMGLKGIITLLLMLLSLIGISSYEVEASKSLSKIEDLELERQLKILNKPALKTFRTEVGDIIDCIDIYKQPAFDHPLLKNHKIQMRPSFIPKGEAKEDSLAAEDLHVMFNGEECPSGTVPIRRTKKEDLLRAKSLSREFVSHIGQRKARFPGQSIVSLAFDRNGKLPNLHGASAVFNVYNPTVANDQFTNAQIWIERGPYDQANNIQAGWTVHPRLYGDTRTRLFTFWTGDGFNKTGCYNTLCPGFVQVDKSLFPNAPISNVSTYGGQQFVIKISVYQDKETGNWWLIVTDKSIHVGYWPKSIFTHLADGADDVAWGGLASAGPNGVSPPMGSGHFPDDDYSHSCYFKWMEMMDGFYGIIRPTAFLSLKKRVDNPGCYNIKDMGFNSDRGYGAMFGGPGGNCG